MQLIDRYVAQVGRHLPDKLRADIESEIRSTLEDMLEDRSRKTGRPIDETLQAEVVQEYGAPEKVAGSYLPPRYLIGPRLYPLFTLVLRVVLAVMVGVGLFRFGLMVIQGSLTSATFLQLTGQIGLETLGAALSAFGNVVLVFAILELSLGKVKMDEAKWDPRQLPPVADPERIKLGEIVFEVVLTLGALLVFNFYPQIIRLGFFTNGQWTFAPVLSAAFFSYLPWINLIGGLQIVHKLIVLRQGRWQPATRWFSLAVDVLDAGLIYLLLTGPAIVGLTAADLQAATDLKAATAAQIVGLTTASVSLGLAIALIVQVIEIVITLYNLLVKRRRPAPAAV